MALASTTIFLHIRNESDADRTKHEAKKALRKLKASLTLTMENADVVVFHNGSEMVLQNAVGLRKPIVSPAWLTACRDANRLLDVAPFTLVDSRTSSAVVKANASPVSSQTTAAVAPSSLKVALIDSDDERPMRVPRTGQRKSVRSTVEQVVPTTDRPFLADLTVADDGVPPIPTAPAAVSPAGQRRSRPSTATETPPAVASRRSGRAVPPKDEEFIPLGCALMSSSDSEQDCPGIDARQSVPRAIALSGLTSDSREQLRGIVTALGSTVVDDVFGRTGTKPSHLVVDGTTVSPKILLALCLGIPLVQPAWVYASLCAGRWLPLETAGDHGPDFFIPLFDRESFRARQALVIRRDPRMLADRPVRGPQLLASHVLFFAGNSTYPGNGVFQELVELVGGDVTRSEATTSLTAIVLMESVDEDRVISCATPPRAKKGHRTESKSPGKPRVRALHRLLQAAVAQNTPVITPQWVIDSIAQCRALPYNEYLASIDGQQGLMSLDAKPGAATPTHQIGKRSCSDPFDIAESGLAALAMKKRSPGPPSAVKDHAHQWSTQQLRQSQSPDVDSE